MKHPTTESINDDLYPLVSLTTLMNICIHLLSKTSPSSCKGQVTFRYAAYKTIKDTNIKTGD